MVYISTAPHLSMYRYPTGMNTAQMAIRTSRLYSQPINSTRRAPRKCPNLAGIRSDT